MDDIQSKVSTHDLSEWINLPPEELDKISKTALDEVGKEADLHKRFELLKDASSFGVVYKLRSEFHAAKKIHSQKAEAFEFQREALNNAIKAFNRAGERILLLSDEDMPVIKLRLV